MLRDGATATGCLFDPDLVSATFLKGVDGILLVRTGSATESDPTPSLAGTTDQVRAVGSAPRPTLGSC
jgi:hypothetical protein